MKEEKQQEAYDCYVCQDCLMFIANGDLSGLDYALSKEDADEKEQAIKEGIELEANAGGYYAAGDSERDHEFSRWPCDCCGEMLAGSRHHAVVIYR